jgi:LAS superfamily LD-carboxypeptidase LdcB
MSRFSSFFDALSDKKARFLAEKQIVNDLIFDFYFNSLRGQGRFNAVVISGGNSGNSTEVIEGEGQDLIAIKVRPIEIQGLALPNPCSEACKGQSESYRAYLYALHPTAYSDPNDAGGNTTAPAFGSTVECYFEDRKRFRQLRWTSETASPEGNSNYKCEELGKLVSNFDGAVPLGDIKTNQLEGTYVGNKVESLKGQTVKNGSLPPELLKMTEKAANNKLLLIDAAADFDKLADAYYKKFNERIKLNEGYRSFEKQINTKRLKIEEDKATQAATPGESRHGWGMAIDISTEYNGVRGFKSEIYKWMSNNASGYGWSNPSWASDGHNIQTGEPYKDPDGNPVKKSKNDEPWHWEYIRPGIKIK